MNLLNRTIFIILNLHLLFHTICLGLDDNTISLLVIKQNIGQYNSVYQGLLNKTNKSENQILIDVLNIVQDQKKNPVTDHSAYSAILSIGTNAFRYALDNFPDQSHLFGMIMNVNQTRIKSVISESKKSVSGHSILVNPAIYLNYAKQIQNNLKTIGLLYASDEFDHYINDIRSKAEEAKIRLIIEKVSQKQKFSECFDSVIKSQIDTFLIIPDFTLYDAKSLNHVYLRTYNQGIPCIGPSESFVNSGALWAFSVIPEEIGSQLGQIIIDNPPKQGLSVEYYTPSLLCINMIVAENLEIDIPYRLRKEAKLIDPRQENEN